MGVTKYGVVVLANQVLALGNQFSFFRYFFACVFVETITHNVCCCCVNEFVLYGEEYGTETGTVVSLQSRYVLKFPLNLNSCGV